MLKKTVLLGLLVSTSALAQEAPKPDAAATPPVATGTDNTIIVTANRAPTPADQVAASVTLLDKPAIDRAGDFAVADLLQRTPGVTISRNGGYGTATSLRIRGAETDQTVVVIDGVKLNDPSAVGGGYNFANLLVGDASRIEVLRGPGSTLWGSQAIGGVVNIVTALPTKPLEGSFDVEAGSRETVSGRAAIGGITGPLAWRIGGQSFTTDGISAIARSAGGTERDGYTNRTATARGVLTIADGISADLRGYYSDGKAGIDGFDGDSPELAFNEEFVGYAGLNVDLFEGRFRNRFAYGYTDTDRDNIDPRRARATTFSAKGRNERLEYQGSFALTTRWNAVFGVENERSRFSTVSPPASLATPVPESARARAEITGVYGQLTGQVIDGLTLTGGVRHDDHSRFGSKTLFSGGAVWALGAGTVIRANYSEGFKAPTLYQLFSEYGNNALAPERARGWEAGAEQRFLDGRVTVGGTYFERRTRDQIDYFSCYPAQPDNPLCLAPGTTTSRYGYYANIARTFTRGVEAVGQVRLNDRLSADANYSWIAAENRSGGADDGNWLARRPRHAANGAVSYSLPSGASAGVAVRWSGKSFENASNTTRLDDYTLVDLRLELPVSSEVRVFARAENVFDEEYQTAFGYGTLGRSIYAGLRGRF